MLQKIVGLIFILFAMISLSSVYGESVKTYQVGISAWTVYPANVKGFKEKTAPARLQSKLQGPPLILINQNSANILNIKIPAKRKKNIHFVK